MFKKIWISILLVLMSSHSFAKVNDQLEHDGEAIHTQDGPNFDNDSDIDPDDVKDERIPDESDEIEPDNLDSETEHS